MENQGAGYGLVVYNNGLTALPTPKRIWPNKFDLESEQSCVKLREFKPIPLTGICQKAIVMTIENEMRLGQTAVSEKPAVSDTAQEATPLKPIARRGDVTKCPICGSSIDPDAYHCAQCRNYFCFHCRARLLPSDTQEECVNLACGYYGKLVCGICDPPHDKEEAPMVYAEPIDGYWPLWLLIALVAGAVVWYLTTWWIGILLAILLYGLGGYQLQKSGINIFGKESLVTQPRSSSYRTCIQCQQPVKEIQVARS